MRSRLSVLGIFLTLTVLATGCIPTPPPPPAKPYPAPGTTFAVLGDVPYGDVQVQNFPYLIDQVNANPELEWVTHLGDIKSGSSLCTDEYFDWVKSQFDQIRKPLVYTPGDNEWTDCHRPNNGGYNPLERLQAIRSRFFPTPNTSLGQHPMAIESQLQPDGTIENALFNDGGATVATLHLVGSNNGLAPWTGNTEPTSAQALEEKNRTDAALALIDWTFARAVDRKSDLVVLITQADMFDPTIASPNIANFSAFTPIVSELVQESSKFKGKVLLLDGDSHVFADDKPLSEGSKWLDFYGISKGVSNLNRLTVEGSTKLDEYLQVTVDRTTPNGYTYKRVPLAPTPVMNVRLNEVESSNGTPGDWVELANTSSTALDASGLVLKDNDDTHLATLPSGSIIPPNGYLTVEESTLGFGLGGADSARLFAKDGKTLLDTTTWSTHAPSSWGRCGDKTGTFVVTSAPTKNAANDCTPLVKLNEVESSNGTPGDWAELYNPGPSPSDLSGWTFKDNDDTHTYTLPAGTVIGAGQYLVLEESTLGFGLGSADSARLFRPDATLADSYSWTTHATTTYGRCPDATGPFATTSAATKAAANTCGGPVTTVVVSEVESSNGTPGDWAELYNPGPSPSDLSGWTFKDNDDTHTYTLPAGTVIGAGQYLVLEESTLGFGLGSADSARLFRPDATLADSYSWTTHATTTYGRCPDATGPFATTSAATKAAANQCEGATTFEVWPGGASVTTVDDPAAWSGNMSGLSYVGSGSSAPGTMWAVRNGPGSLFKLVWNGTSWVSQNTADWQSGKVLRFADGTGDVDAEGVEVLDSANVYVGAERNNAVSGTSRNTVLQFNAETPGTSLTATREWNLTADLPATGANAGIEAITFVPDAYLVANGFKDENTTATYDPATYPNHNGGLFLVGLEGTGGVYAYELDHTDGTFTRVATIASGFPAVMDLEFDAELGQLWAVCDDTCQGRSAILTIPSGQFKVLHSYERPTGLENLNNEGFTIAPNAECVGGFRPVFYADDSDTGTYSIRRGTLACV